MTNGPNITVVNVAISIVVPLVSVMAAHQFTSSRDRRNSVRQAFVDLLRHLQQFRNAIIRVNAAKYWAVDPETRQRLFTGMVSADTLGPHNPVNELTAAHMDLTADVLLMGMLLGRKDTRLVPLIKETIDFQTKMDPLPGEKMSEHLRRCEAALRDLTQKTMNEVAAVWNSLEQSFESP